MGGSPGLGRTMRHSTTLSILFRSIPDAKTFGLCPGEIGYYMLQQLSKF